MTRHSAPYKGATPYWTPDEAQEMLDRYGLSVEQFLALMDELQEGTLSDMSDIAWSVEEVLLDNG